MLWECQAIAHESAVGITRAGSSPDHEAVYVRAGVVLAGLHPRRQNMLVFFDCWDLQLGQTTSTESPQVIIQDNLNMWLFLRARTGPEWKIHFSILLSFFRLNAHEFYFNFWSMKDWFQVNYLWIIYPIGFVHYIKCAGEPVLLFFCISIYHEQVVQLDLYMDLDIKPMWVRPRQGEPFAHYKMAVATVSASMYLFTEPATNDCENNHDRNTPFWVNQSSPTSQSSHHTGSVIWKKRPLWRNVDEF